MKPSVPVVDYRKAKTEHAAFVRDVFDSLAGTGFMLLDHVDGLEDASQQQCFEAAHKFFQLDTETKMEYGLSRNPHFRGWGSPGGTALGGALMVEAFQFGAPCEPVAPHDDTSVPLWRRVLRGPNIWPTEEHAPNLRPTIEALHARYFKLSRQLGHVLSEAMGVDNSEYDSFFDLEDPDLLAALNHNIPIQDMPADLQPSVAEAFNPSNEGAGLGYGASGHTDGAPFVTLLIADSPGLQALALDGTTWIDVTPGPGQVVVNIGATLAKLSNRQLRATVHRVNPLLHTGRRCSLPYFLLPKLEVRAMI
jgi:isopenicillin N synthase-like dioxygenase